MNNIVFYTFITILIISILIISYNLYTSIIDIENILSTDINNTPVKVDSNLANIPIYIINFSHKKDRNIHMKNIMTKLGFNNYKFIEPVSKRYIKNNYSNVKNISTLSRFLTTIKIFKMSKADKFIIFEDDIDVYNKVTSLNQIYYEASKVDYDLLYFEICYALCLKSVKISPKLYLLSEPLCNGAVLYTNKFVNKFNKFIENYDITLEPIDNFIISMEKNNLIKCVGYPYFRQNPNFGSEITTSARFGNKYISYDPLCRVI